MHTPHAVTIVLYQKKYKARLPCERKSLGISHPKAKTKYYHLTHRLPRPTAWHAREEKGNGNQTSETKPNELLARLNLPEAT